MPIRFTCPYCKKVLRVKEQMAGRKGTCPACRKMLIVPALSASTPEAEKASQALEELALATVTQQEKPASTTVTFPCPFCDAEIAAEAELAGKQTVCPECRRIVKVPQSEASARMDWRQAHAPLPSMARRHMESMEQSWGTETARGHASREALLEAGAIREEKPPWGVWGWTWRIGSACALLVLAFVLWSWYRSWSHQSLEQRAFELATSEGAQLPSPAQAVFLRLRAHHCQAARARDDAKRPLSWRYLQAARLHASQLRDPLDRQCALRDILLDQVHFHAPAEDLAQTLRMMEAGWPRFYCIREMARACIQQGRWDVARQAIMEAIPAPPLPAQAQDKSQNDTAAHSDSERLNCLAILGQELALAQRADDAKKLLAEMARSRPHDKKLPRSYYGLCLVHWPPDSLQGESDQDTLAGKVEGHLTCGRLKEARLVLQEYRLPSVLRLELLLLLAQHAVHFRCEVTDMEEILQEAHKLASSYGADTFFHHVVVCELAHKTHRSALIQTIEQETVGRRTHEWIRLVRLRQLATAGTLHWDTVEGWPPGSLPFCEALALVARCQAQQDSRTVWSRIQDLPPQARADRAFIALGLALALCRSAD